MDKLNKARRLWLALVIIALVSIFLGTPLLALAALKGYYVVAGILVVIVSHGFYGFPFYLRAFRRTRIMRVYLSLLNEGVSDGSIIEEHTRLTEAARAEYLERMIKKGYYNK